MMTELFCGSVSSDIAEEMQKASGFKLGKLPVRYLGVPLITSKLNYFDCKPLIGRITTGMQRLFLLPVDYNQSSL